MPRVGSNRRFPPVCLSVLFAHAIPRVVEMHEFGHLVPFDRIAGAMRAEHRIRRVLQVGFRIVSHVLDHLVGIVARLVAGEYAA